MQVGVLKFEEKLAVSFLSSGHRILSVLVTKCKQPYTHLHILLPGSSHPNPATGHLPAKHLELHITPLASPARPLDLEDVLPISILDGEPRVDKGAVLDNIADGGARGRLDLHSLEAAEAAPGITPVGTHQVDHLHTHTNSRCTHIESF